MKVKKGGFIAMICVAAVSALIATALVLIPLFNRSPIRISQPFSLTKATDAPNTWIWHGALKNESDTEVRLFGLNVEVHTNDSYFDMYGPMKIWDWFEDGGVTLQAGEEFSVEGLRTGFGIRNPDSVTGIEIDIRLAGDEYARSYTLLGGAKTFTVVAIVLYVLAAVFALCGVLILYGSQKKVKRYETMRAFAESMDATFLNGYIGEQGSVGKAVGKSILSVLGGMLSAIFLGVGFYKIHSARNLVKKECIVTKDGLYLGVPNAKPDTAAMQRISKEQLVDCMVTADKKQVQLIAPANLLLFRANENALDVQAIAALLRQLIAPVQPFEDTATEEVTTEQKTEDVTPEQ